MVSSVHAGGDPSVLGRIDQIVLQFVTSEEVAQANDICMVAKLRQTVHKNLEHCFRVRTGRIDERNNQLRFGKVEPSERQL